MEKQGKRIKIIMSRMFPITCKIPQNLFCETILFRSRQYDVVIRWNPIVIKYLQATYVIILVLDEMCFHILKFDETKFFSLH